MNKSPAAIVKEKFGDKAKLLAALGPFTQDDLWLARANTKKGLERVSNAKLLRLHSVFSEVKEKFGTRVKLVDAVCDLEKRTKDEGYRNRLLAYPVPRLYDLYRSVSKRSRPGDAAKSPSAKAPAARSGAEARPATAPKATAAATPAKAAAGEPTAKAPKKAEPVAKAKPSKSS